MMPALNICSKSTQLKRETGCGAIMELVILAKAQPKEKKVNGR